MEIQSFWSIEKWKKKIYYKYGKLFSFPIVLKSNDLGSSFDEIDEKQI